MDNQLGMSAQEKFHDLAQDQETLRRIFLNLGLAGADEKPAVTALTGGVSSGIYRVDLRSGSYCLKQALPKLKVAKEWLAPVERVFSEYAWLQTAAAIVPGHVPRVLGQDEAYKCFVMELLGPAYRNWKAEMLAGRVTPENARRTGEVLGRIHAATAHDTALAKRFATDDNFYALRLEPYLVETARVHAKLSEQLLKLAERTAQTKRVLVHGDVSPKNILIGSNGNDASPVLLDAECAWYGDPAFDLAFCLNHFLLKTAHLPQHQTELIASFRAMAQAYLAHVRWESAADVEMRVATLLPGLLLARIDGKSPVEYLDEAARSRVRSSAIALLEQAPEQLETIASNWLTS